MSGQQRRILMMYVGILVGLVVGQLVIWAVHR